MAHGSAKHRGKKQVQGGSQPRYLALVSVPILRCLQAGTWKPRSRVWKSFAADHSQTKLLSSSHLTTDYTCLILSIQFERTIITARLILPLNILLRAGRLWSSAAQGVQLLWMVWGQGCGAAGMGATSLGTRKVQGGLRGAPVLAWKNHVSYMVLNSFLSQPWRNIRKPQMSMLCAALSACSTRSGCLS